MLMRAYVHCIHISELHYDRPVKKWIKTVSRQLSQLIVAGVFFKPKLPDTRNQ